MHTMFQRGPNTQHTCGRIASPLPGKVSVAFAQPRPQPKSRSKCSHTAICCTSRRYPGSSGRKLRNVTSCQAQDTETDTSTSEEAKADKQEHSPVAAAEEQGAADTQEQRDRISDTLAGLDALLGIEEEVAKDEAKQVCT